MKVRKAIALLSGGLDSVLAAKLVKDLGIEVIGLHLILPFGGRSSVEASAQEIEIPLIKRNRGDDFLDLVQNPRYGYGKNMNPCIDCRINMFRTVKKVMEEQGADFVITGEVLGQRPMSQNRGSMDLIDRRSETEGLILRPLSAKCFPPTIAEEQGWVDREKLLEISGRSRYEQYALAKKWGITQFASPGGGCLLTEKQFAPKLRDFYQHEHSEYRLNRCELLPVGRHFRLSDETKVILGRNEGENKKLANKWKDVGGIYFEPLNFIGPDAVALGQVGEEEKNLIGQLIAHYGKTNGLEEKKISCESDEGKGIFEVSAVVSLDQLEGMKIL